MSIGTPTGSFASRSKLPKFRFQREVEMALTDIVLSLMAFPQRVQAGVLHARVLLLPAFDPRQPVAGLPAFSGTGWSLRASVLPGIEALIGSSSGTVAQTHSFLAAAPAGSAALFDALDAQFKPV